MSPQEVVETDSGSSSNARASGTSLPTRSAYLPPDVVLYDVLALHESDASDLELLVKQNGTLVIAVGRDLRPDLQARALDHGAVAAVSLGVTAEDLHGVLVAALAGSLDEATGRTSPGRRPAVGARGGAQRPRVRACSG